MKTHDDEKTYIGQTEAWEITIAWGLDELPTNRTEHLHVPSIVENLQHGLPASHFVALGHDNDGYYIQHRVIEGM